MGRRVSAFFPHFSQGTKPKPKIANAAPATVKWHQLANASRACGGSRGVYKTARWGQTKPTVMCRGKGTRKCSGVFACATAPATRGGTKAGREEPTVTRTGSRGRGRQKPTSGAQEGPPKPTAGAQEGTPNPPEGGPSRAPKTHQGGPRGPTQAGTTPERRTRNVSPCGASKGKRRQHKAPTIAAD